MIFQDFSMEKWWSQWIESVRPFFTGITVSWNHSYHHPWRIHGAGIYANMTGVYWWDPCYHSVHGSYGSLQYDDFAVVGDFKSPSKFECWVNLHFRATPNCQVSLQDGWIRRLFKSFHSLQSPTNLKILHGFSQEKAAREWQFTAKPQEGPWCRGLFFNGALTMPSMGGWSLHPICIFGIGWKHQEQWGESVLGLVCHGLVWFENENPIVSMWGVGLVIQVGLTFRVDPIFRVGCFSEGRRVSSWPSIDRLYMGVSINVGIPKWMVYNGKPC